MAGILDWITESAKKQYQKGAPYREAASGLLQGDTSKANTVIDKSIANLKTPEGAMDVALNFSPLSIGGVLKNIPTPKGGWTNEKIAKALKQFNYTSQSGSVPQRLISEFSSPEEFAQNLYWHGTGGSLQGGLKPSIAIPTKELERIGGGGYGQQYYGASVSKDKNLASNFTGQSRTGSVYPVILNKNANVIEMKNLEDAIDLEDIAAKLWNDKVDAVKIGNWTSPSSERELAILNPYSAYVINQPTRFPVFQKQKFENPSIDEITKMYNISKQQIPILDELKRIGGAEASIEREKLLKGLLGN